MDEFIKFIDRLINVIFVCGGLSICGFALIFIGIGYWPILGVLFAILGALGSIAAKLEYGTAMDKINKKGGGVKNGIFL